MKKAAIIFLLFSAACYPKRNTENPYMPVPFYDVCGLADKKDISHFVEVEGYLGTPGFIDAPFGADGFNFYATQDDTVAIEAVINVSYKRGRSCVVLPGFEYDTDDLKIAVEDSTLIGFREKIKLRGQVLRNNPSDKSCVISVQEIVKAGN